jgi:hypothetical protein
MTADEIQARFPVISHGATGDCCGCIVVTVRGRDAELSCNECGVVVGVVDAAILEALVAKNPIAQFRDVRHKRPDSIVKKHLLGTNGYRNSAEA